MKIATWNVNSILARMQNLMDWLKTSKPDVVMLQEIRCQNTDFPSAYLENFGYNLSINGEKGRNGVAIMSKFPIEEVVYTTLPGCPIPDGKEIPEARYLELIISGDLEPVRLATVYVPNGGDVSLEMENQCVNETPKFKYKLEFLDVLYQHLQSSLNLDELFIVGGDFNICPELMDMYTPKKDGEVCCHIDERRKFRMFKNLGYSDVYRSFYPDRQEFSWWCYRHNAWERNEGMRIDHFLASPLAIDKITAVEIESSTTRNEKKPSDHAPVSCILQA